MTRGEVSEVVLEIRNVEISLAIGMEGEDEPLAFVRMVNMYPHKLSQDDWSVKALTGPLLDNLEDEIQKQLIKVRDDLRGG